LSGNNEGRFVEMVAGIAAGNHACEAELVAEFDRAVQLWIRHVVKDPDNAADIYQTVFTLAIGKLRKGELQDAKALPGWMRSLARNQALMWTQRAHPEREQTVPEGISCHQPDPLYQMLRAEQGRHVLALLEELRHPRDKDVLYRSYYLNQDKATICSEMGLDRGQLNRILSRARERYKELFQSSHRANPTPNPTKTKKS